MKTIYLFLTATCISILFIRCSNSASNDHAEELCECIKEVGLDEKLSLHDLSNYKVQREIERRAERVLPKCLASVMRKMDDHISDLDKAERKEYSKALMKNIIDTECSDIILDKVPFDMLGLFVDELKESAKIREELLNEFEKEANEFERSMDLLNETPATPDGTPEPVPAIIHYQSSDLGTTEYLQLHTREEPQRWVYFSDKNSNKIELEVSKSGGTDLLYFKSAPKTKYRINYVSCGFYLTNTSTGVRQYYLRTHPICN